MTPASLRALLAGTVDYAGLFPPATLTLEEALRNYAEYSRSEDAWMLGPFVLPVDQFADAERHLDAFDADHPLRVSALGRRTMNIADFSNAIDGHAETIARWKQAQAGRVQITQLEMALPTDFDRNLFGTIYSVLAPLKLQTFWEAPADDAERAIATVANHNAGRPSEPLGFKLRTGGVTADAFPEIAKVAHALVCAARFRVPIKFTAGLHHPVRLFHESVKTKMHGFLNVFAAGVFAVENRWAENETQRVLEEEDPGSFIFSGDSMKWRDHEILADQIAAARGLITSFGSCSFDEPREDLRALNLL